jgi:hypothetical protein
MATCVAIPMYRGVVASGSGKGADGSRCALVRLFFLFSLRVSRLPARMNHPTRPSARKRKVSKEQRMCRASAGSPLHGDLTPCKGTPPTGLRQHEVAEGVTSRRCDVMEEGIKGRDTELTSKGGRAVEEALIAFSSSCGGPDRIFYYKLAALPS